MLHEGNIFCDGGHMTEHNIMHGVVFQFCQRRVVFVASMYSPHHKLNTVSSRHFTHKVYPGIDTRHHNIKESVLSFPVPLVALMRGNPLSGAVLVQAMSEAVKGVLCLLHQGVVARHQ